MKKYKRAYEIQACDFQKICKILKEQKVGYFVEYRGKDNEFIYIKEELKNDKERIIK